MNVLNMALTGLNGLKGLNGIKAAAALSFAAFFMPQAMACYTVYNPSNQVVYAGPDTPIDMSYQIHQRLPAAFPGGHMVFNLSSDCLVVDTRKVAPLLSNVADSGGQQPAGARPPRAVRN
jgi:hypothetical protein